MKMQKENERQQSNIKSETQAKDAPGFRYEDYMDEYDEYDEYEDGEYEEYEEDTENEPVEQEGVTEWQKKFL